LYLPVSNFALVKDKLTFLNGKTAENATLFFDEYIASYRHIKRKLIAEVRGYFWTSTLMKAATVVMLYPL
jgi:hypothetical protein